MSQQRRVEDEKENQILFTMRGRVCSFSRTKISNGPHQIGMPNYSCVVFKIQIHVTSQTECITNKIPQLKVHLLRNLDKYGIVTLGFWYRRLILSLIGKLTPQTVKEFSYAPKIDCYIYSIFRYLLKK